MISIPSTLSESFPFSTANRQSIGGHFQNMSLFLWEVHLSLCCFCTMYSFTNIRTQPSGFQCGLQAGHSSGIFRVFGAWLGLLRHPVWKTEQLLGVQPWCGKSLLNDLDSSCNPMTQTPFNIYSLYQLCSFREPQCTHLHCTWVAWASERPWGSWVLKVLRIEAESHTYQSVLTPETSCSAWQPQEIAYRDCTAKGKP